jgi:hypothetical protein
MDTYHECNDKTAEEYTLEQKKEALSVAEQELNTLLRSSEDFFDTKEEMDKTLHELLQHPDAVYTKPFMKKIATAVLRVNTCRQDVEWASEAVVDTGLTPAQLKAQFKQMLDTQRMEMEQRCTMMSDVMMQMETEWTTQLKELRKEFEVERVGWKTQLRELRKELEEERRHRKAFQAKVKDFSEEIIVSVGMSISMMGHVQSPVPLHHHAVEFNTLIGQRYYTPPGCSTVKNNDNSYIYKRAGCIPLPLPTDPTYQTLYDADRVNRDKAWSDFKFTTFDGTEK